MGKPDRPTDGADRWGEFLEPGEQVEKMLAGRRASFANIFYPFGRINRQVVLTDRNLYVFELEGRERRMKGTPSKVLCKHPRGGAPARSRAMPTTFFVGEEQIRPAGTYMAALGPVIARAAAPPRQSSD
jgi:hypothetical protein